LIKLGGSHLVCLNFFKLEALGGDFASKAREVMARLGRGEGCWWSREPTTYALRALLQGR